MTKRVWTVEDIRSIRLKAEEHAARCAELRPSLYPSRSERDASVYHYLIGALGL